MPNFDRYGEFFEKYSPPNQKPPQNFDPKPTVPRKRKRKKNRYVRLALFLTPYILGAVAIVVTICLVASLFGKKSASGTYTTIASEETVFEEIVEEPVLFNPVANDDTVSLGKEIQSEYAVLVDCSTSLILAQKGGDTKIYPASMTKIMAVLVAIEHIDNLDDTFQMTSTLIDPLYRAGSTMAGFMPGEVVRLRDMFYGAVLESGGEAIVGLATYVAGSEESFVALMNEKATELGLSSTHFCNASGLHDKNHYTTCREMAIIMQAALSDEFCREVISTEYYTVAANDHHEELKFHSGMFTRMHGDEPEVAEIKGGKTGYTVNSGNCLVSYAKTDDGREIICVTAKGGGKYVPVYDCFTLYKEYTH